MNKKIIVVVVGAVIKNGKVLLTKRQEWDTPEYEDLKAGPWQIPGGGLEFGETTEEGTVREIKEETGLDVKVKVLVPKIFHEHRGEWHGVFITYVCEMKNPHQEVVINEEASEWEWCNLEEIRRKPCLPKTAEIAELIFECYNHDIKN